MSPTMFTRMHYEATVAVLGRTRPSPSDRPAHDQWELMVREFCKMMMQDNPDFDLKRFLTALKATTKGD